jgi:CO/xanthine dehydrogenase FAD-binding subunit
LAKQQNSNKVCLIPFTEPSRLGWSHIKFTPRSVEDFATVDVAITLSAKNGICEDVRLGLNSLASIIVHAKQAEKTLRGKTISDDLLRQIGEIAAGETDPVDDNHGFSVDATVLLEFDFISGRSLSGA